MFLCSTVEESEFRNLPGGGAEKCEPVLQKEAAKVRGKRQALGGPTEKVEELGIRARKGGSSHFTGCRGLGHSPYMVSFSVSTLL